MSYLDRQLSFRDISMADTANRSQQTKIDKQDQHTQDRDRWIDLGKGSSENYLGGEPLLLTLAIFLQDS